jgi:hypothetical protein
MYGTLPLAMALLITGVGVTMLTMIVVLSASINCADCWPAALAGHKGPGNLRWLCVCLRGDVVDPAPPTLALTGPEHIQTACRVRR